MTEQIIAINKAHLDREKEWARERADLLDRSQAESFREYKSQAIRMTRAQSKAEPEAPPFELL